MTRKIGWPISGIKIISLLGAILVASNAVGQDLGTPLRSKAQSRGFLIGAAVDSKPFSDDAAYSETLAREFNAVTAEGAMKFRPLRPTRDRFNFQDADKIVDFAAAQGMKVRGHTLVWHSAIPRWLRDGNFSKDEIATILKEHIQTTIRHFRGSVDAWDVVNEAIDDATGLRQTFWLKALGNDYIAQALIWAREADPRVKLFYNDYGGEALGAKSDAIYNLLKSLKGRGIPIDGVGLQSHFLLESSPKMEDVATNMKRLAALGLEIQVTEFDVRMVMPPTEQKLQDQAQIYRAYLSTCLAIAKCTAFLTWGITDKYSWIPRSFPGTGSALPFDENFRPKPAYRGLEQAFDESRRH